MSFNASREGMLLALVGPTGSGKSTLVNKLLEEFVDSLVVSISATTRTPRSGEEDGKHYHFLDRADFEAKVANNEFFEWEEVHGNLYGTLRSTIESHISTGKDVLLDVDIKGALNFKEQLLKYTVLVFVDVPDRSTLIDRVKKRDNIDDEELKLRLSTADQEYSIFIESCSEEHGFDYYLVNDSLDEAYANMKAILLSERLRLSRLVFNLASV